MLCQASFNVGSIDQNLFLFFFDFISSISIINVNMDHLPETMDPFFFLFSAKCRASADSSVLTKLHGGYFRKDSACINAH